MSARADKGGFRSGVSQADNSQSEEDTRYWSVGVGNERSKWHDAGWGGRCDVLMELGDDQGRWDDHQAGRVKEEAVEAAGRGRLLDAGIELG